jgi:hypothetical protein
LIQLASQAGIAALELDTAHFTGNHVPKVSIQIADLSSEHLGGLVKQLPHAFERLIHGGVQGAGQTPDEVRQALEACKSVEWNDLLPIASLLPGYKTSRMH